MMKLIGLTGYAGSGKDYTFGKLADFFADEEVVRYALADEVRIEAADEVLDALRVWELDLGYLGTWKKPYSEAQRRLLQWWGTEFRRAQDPEYWVRKVRERLEAADHYLAVVTDVRFENEAAMIRDLGGLVVQTQTTDEIRAERLGGEVAPPHASEVIDYEVDDYVGTSTPGRVVLGPTVSEYLGLPVNCTKCRTLYRAHPWHDDGTFFEGSGLDLRSPTCNFGPGR